jgi:TorA maturation chaperone TorD
MPPTGSAFAEALRTTVAEDLASLAEELELDLDAELDALRTSLVDIPDASALLVDYSGLFLAPPIKARLNLGYYLDGSLNGPTQDTLGEYFAHYGVERSERFRDLPDHLALQLEFLALLVASSAQDDDTPGAYARRFLLPALPALCRDIEANGRIDSPYLPLVRIASAALQALAADDEQAVPRRKRNRRTFDPSKGELRCCKVCGQPFAREKEIRIMAKALAEHGLPAEHLDTCPDCRSPVQGWQRKPVR